MDILTTITKILTESNKWSITIGYYTLDSLLLLIAIIIIIITIIEYKGNSIE